MVKKDINNMTVEEIATYLQERKEQEIKDRQEKAIRAKAELEAYCQEKYGLTLAQVFTASDKVQTRKQYQNPEDKKLYSYSGRGKVPGWLKGTDGKPNPQFEVKSN
jgi:hypothetical protein